MAIPKSAKVDEPPPVPQLEAVSNDPTITLQPECSTISADQLAAEIKGIYDGLIMVESRCIDIDAALTHDVSSPLGVEQWQALIRLHRTLLYEHHDFLVATQHPSASPKLRSLAEKFSMPAKMWKHGIHAFLEVLRCRLPHSVDHMMAFVVLAYEMMSLLLDTAPTFADTWVECLGDLARYRMAIEEDPRAHAHWYTRASDRHPDIGRLYHHLGILERPSMRKLASYCSAALESRSHVGRPWHHLRLLERPSMHQFSSYCKSLVACLQPFSNARGPGESCCIPVAETSLLATDEHMPFPWQPTPPDFKRQRLGELLGRLKLLQALPSGHKGLRQRPWKRPWKWWNAAACTRVSIMTILAFRFFASVPTAAAQPFQYADDRTTAERIAFEVFANLHRWLPVLPLTMGAFRTYRLVRRPASQLREPTTIWNLGMATAGAFFILRTFEREQWNASFFALVAWFAFWAEYATASYRLIHKSCRRTFTATLVLGGCFGTLAIATLAALIPGQGDSQQTTNLALDLAPALLGMLALALHHIWKRPIEQIAGDSSLDPESGTRFGIPLDALPAHSSVALRRLYHRSDAEENPWISERSPTSRRGL